MINTGYGQPLKKAIQEVQDTLKKASGVNLSFSEKGKDDMKKVDPKTKLPGVMLDKVASGDIGAGSMGSSGMNLTPGSGNQGGVSKQEKVGGAPSDAPPMLASEKHDGLKQFMQKCMKHMNAKKSMAAMSEKPAAAPMKKASAATTGHISENQPKQPNVSVRVGGDGHGRNGRNGWYG